MNTIDLARRHLGQRCVFAASVAAAFAWGCSGSDSTTDENAAATGGKTGNPSGAGAISTGGASSELGVGGTGVTAFGGRNAASGGNGVSTGGSTEARQTASTGGTSSTATRASGGAASTGGMKATGGVTAFGGARTSGGSLATGGAASGGGTRAAGGVQASGGTKTAGGTASAGGSKSTGGSLNVGGTRATGGSSASSSGCFSQPAQQVGKQATASTIDGYGTVMLWAHTPRKIVRLQTTMVVPPKPAAAGTLFLWPGLQPYGENFDPIDNGVLQPVLTWGPSCSPGTQPRAYSSWWISGQYVNTNGNVTGYTGCEGGPIMSVNVCDTLDIDMSLAGTVWTQTVTDEQTGHSVAYSIDMQSQAQNLAYFVIEEYSSVPVSEVIFTDTIVTFDAPDTSDCKVNTRGQSDYISAPAASSDGLQCTIDQIILRAQGIQ